MDAGDPRDGSDHHAREQLHGGYVAFVECAGRRGENLEDPEGAAEVAERRNKNRTNTQTAAAGKVNARIALGIVTQHDLPGANGFGGNAGIGLQADSKIGGSASGTGAANNFVAGTQRDGGPGGSGKMLRAFCDGADRGLEIEFRGMNLILLTDAHSAESRNRMRGIRYAQLTAHGERGHSGMIVNVLHLRGRHTAQQVANQAVEFAIGDEMGSLLLE
jgi:hypothetical protein